MCEISTAWAVNEMEQLRADIEEAESERAFAQWLADDYRDDSQKWQIKYEALERDFDSKLEQVNLALRDKCMTFLDLIAQYDKIIKRVGIDNPTIRNLRRKGHLDV